MRAWTNHRVKARIYIKEYVDIDTGELIDEQEYKQNYNKIKKNEYRTEYTRHARITTRTEIGRKNTNNQRELEFR